MMIVILMPGKFVICHKGVHQSRHWQYYQIMMMFALDIVSKRKSFVQMWMWIMDCRHFVRLKKKVMKMRMYHAIFVFVGKKECDFVRTHRQCEKQGKMVKISLQNFIIFV